MKVDQITPYEKNAKVHPRKQIEQVAASIKEFGFNQPIVIDKAGVIIVGHGRFEAAKSLGMDDVPVITVDLTEEQANAYRLADNKLNESEWDMGLVVEELKLLSEPMIKLTGFDIDLTVPTGGHNKLSERFMFPPFSVLDARQGPWQDRKREWLALGIKSEEGRDIDPTMVSKDAPAYMANRGNNEGGSIFDPTLCEVLYHWFMPKDGGTILDPFAGGSVRGVVAAKMGYAYTGVELRKEQVAANIKQGSDLCADAVHMPIWIQGDSNKAIPTDQQYDFVFSCPPYADLEVYSDDPADISNMPYEEFIDVYFSIIEKAVAQLKENRFAAFVVGDIRDTKGVYRNFVSETIYAFELAGARLYNEAILVTPLGSLPVRAAKAFNAGRKLGKTHQNVLVFFKGDTKKIKEIYGELDLTGIDKLSTGA